MKRGSKGKAKGRSRRTLAQPGSSQPAVQVDTDWLQRAEITVPEVKQAISFRIDPDVLYFFKAQGPRYQTRMNAVLRAYVTVHAGDEK